MTVTHPVYTGAPAADWRGRLRRIGPVVALAAGGAACCGFVLWADPTTPGGLLPPCPTKTLTGIICPGCGGTRMMYSLLRGDLPAALHYNAVSLVFVLLFCWSIAAWAVGRWRGRPVNSWLHWRWTPLICAVVLGGWFIVRNLPFPPFDTLYV
ncbi:DUF2752 domain-containing protein [Amycolatopsis suaedae]|uniref:DUF2752 domain-containing protein n=1 Tax=Amycolatopsis suaedae TaxID=2510978 RepID=UPI001F0F357F|nr:DUF2752 domain-containing protein [Amycolatopsis suaedae]